MPGLVQDGRVSLPDLREEIGDLLQRLKRSAVASGREVALEAVCDGLEALPVPILNKVLAKSVRRAFGGSEAADVADVLEFLEEMQSSDAALLRALQELHIDLEELEVGIREIQTELRTVHQALVEAKVAVVHPEYEPRWPVFDNQLRFLLSNLGGGSVIVEELTVVVHGWQPHAVVDYSQPAAPLPELHLKCALDIGTRDYPLLKLNGESQRMLNERGNGTERVVIDLGADQNVAFDVSLNVTYRELSGTTEVRTVVYPEPPQTLRVAFSFDPGWHHIQPERLLERGAVLADMCERFQQLTALLREAALVDEDARRQLLDEGATRIGLPSYTFGVFSWWLNSFVSAFAEIAVLEQRRDLLGVMLNLLQAPRPYEDEFRHGDSLVDSIVALVNDDAARPLVVLMLAAHEPTEREELGRELQAMAI